MCRQAAIESLRGIAPIQAVVSDVDGVLTDGRIGLSSDGATIRSFNMKDGMGTGLLREAGVKVGWCAAGVDDGVIRRRGEHLNVDAIDVGHGDKGERFAAICASLGVAPDRVVYIGDDINDLPAMAMAGLSACPADAVESVRTRVDLVLSMRGGMGCFRELVELILASRGG